MYRHGADFTTRNLMHQLGMPEDADWVRLRSAFLVAGSEKATVVVDGAIRQTFEWAPDPEQRDAWNGHAFEVFGVKLDWIIDPRSYTTLGRSPGPYWVLAGDDGRELYITIWLYRILVSGTHLSVDLTLGHGRGQQRRGSIEGLHLNPSLAAAVRAAHATELVWQLEKATGGRTDKEALRDAVEWARDWLKRHPNSQPLDIGRRQLYETSGMRPKSTDNFLTRHHITLPKIRRALGRDDGI